MPREKWLVGSEAFLWGAYPALWCAALLPAAFWPMPVIAALGAAALVGLSRRAETSANSPWAFALPASGALPLLAAPWGTPLLASLHPSFLFLQYAAVFAWTLLWAGIPAFFWGRATTLPSEGGARLATAALGAVFSHAALAWFGVLEVQIAVSLLHLGLTAARVRAGAFGSAAPQPSLRLTPKAIMAGAALGVGLVTAHRVLTVTSSSWSATGAALWAGALGGAALAAWRRGGVDRSASPWFIAAALAFAAGLAHSGMAVSRLWNDPRTFVVSVAVFPVLGFAFAFLSAFAVSARATFSFAFGALGGALLAWAAIFPAGGALRAFGAGVALALGAWFWRARESGGLAGRSRMQTAGAVLAALMATVWLVSPPVSERLYAVGLHANHDPVAEVEARFEDSAHSAWAWKDFAGNRRLAVDGVPGFPQGNPFLAMAVSSLAHGKARSAAVLWPQTALAAEAARETGVTDVALLFPSPAWRDAHARAFSLVEGERARASHPFMWREPGLDVLELPMFWGTPGGDSLSSREALGVFAGRVGDGGIVHQQAPASALNRAEGLGAWLHAYGERFAGFCRWRFTENDGVLLAWPRPRALDYQRLVAERTAPSRLNDRLADYGQSTPYKMVSHLLDAHAYLPSSIRGMRPFSMRHAPARLTRRSAADVAPSQHAHDSHRAFRLAFDGMCETRDGGELFCVPFAATFRIPPRWEITFQGYEWLNADMFVVMELLSPRGMVWRVAALRSMGETPQSFLDWRIPGGSAAASRGIVSDMPALWTTASGGGKEHAAAVVSCPTSGALYLVDAWREDGAADGLTAFDALRMPQWTCLSYE